MNKNGHVYDEIRKVIYGLPHVGITANEFLTKHIASHGYYQCRYTTGLWRHKWIPLNFSLIVDDFGVKYVRKEHAEHLITCMKN